jgi:hypothetical protein
MFEDIKILLLLKTTVNIYGSFYLVLLESINSKFQLILKEK